MVSPEVLAREDKCPGCKARGHSVCPGADTFRPEDLPPHMWHYQSKYGQYLPMLPVAYHKLTTVQKKGGTYHKSGREVVVSHVPLEAVIERQAQTPEFMAAVKCEWSWVW